MKDVNDLTYEELKAIDYIKPLPNERVYGIVIVPLDEIHDSGYRCMKFILIGKGGVILGAVGGCSDVIHINGIGGYGDYQTCQESIKTGKIDVAAWSIDCLPESGCLRLFNCHGSMKLDDFIGSDFEVYAVKKEKKDEKN